MNALDERTLAHARALRERGVAMPPDGMPAGVILDSWARCMDVGLNASARLSVPVVDRSELAQRRERSDFVRRLAQAELETLSRQISGSNFLLAFADSAGVILDLYADNRFSMSSADAGIVVGSCWSESLAGTNGLGTALATAQAVAVTGLEHYFLQLGDVSCTAAPVHDAHGQIVGVLDASSYYESRQRHTQALVQMAATHIENGLLAHQMRGHLVLAVHPRAEYLGTLSAGLLAFDGDGRLAAANSHARSLLSGLEASRGTQFEELFGEPLDQMLARAHQGADVRLRDALGSALLARVVGRPAWVAPHSGVSLAVGASPLEASALAPALALAAQTTGQGPAQAAAPSRQRLTAQASAPAGIEFLADDPAVQLACQQVQAAVRLGVPILLYGETGTGKEMLARHAHAHAMAACARKGEFVAVNCAALPADLFEAELFGYVPGAFTGARREGSAGLIVAADGGTLLLDEVRELPLRLQAALLRFMDEQTVRPVGGTKLRRVNVQLLAATHADLQAEVAAGNFREDLMYRLNTVRVWLPPLRSRRDLAAAARWVLHGMAPRAALADSALASLAHHSWPGNFRELRSVLTRALLARGDEAGAPLLLAADIDAVLPGHHGTAAAGSLLQRSAAELVRTEFERTGHSVSQTSRNLGISRTTVYRHLRA